MNLFDIDVTDAKDQATTLAPHKGKVLLIVNTASECGFTPQFDGLETLYKKYKDSGFEILGFPCNQFGGQDPGTTDDSVKLCRENYGVTFPMFGKIDVNGANEAPLFAYLKTQKTGLLGKKVKWNFTKFLIDRDGTVIKRFGSTTTPEQLDEHVKSLL